MTSTPPRRAPRAPLHVLIAGGGVAALEAMLALRELASDRVDVELLAPEDEFVYGPLAVAEPFGAGRAARFDLGELVEAGGARLRRGALEAVDAPRSRAVSSQAGELSFDALVIACGARPVPAVPGALTFTGVDALEEFQALLEEVAAGTARRVAFVISGGAGWSLPMYELALMTGSSLRRSGVELLLVTPEEAPLTVFGQAASDAVAALLDAHGIELVAGAYAVGLEAGQLTLTGGHRVDVDRVVALPRLEGPRLPGVPHDTEGFIPVDPHGAAMGIERVWAAGDATAFPVKQGGIAAQQADAVAESIAHLAGAAVTPTPFRPVLRGLLITGEVPRYLRSELRSGQGETSVVAPEALWWPPGKIVGRYLAPFLAERGGLELGVPARGVPVEVELEAD